MAFAALVDHSRGTVMSRCIRSVDIVLVMTADNIAGAMTARAVTKPVHDRDNGQGETAAPPRLYSRLARKPRGRAVKEDFLPANWKSAGR